MLEQFERTALLIGEEGIKKLQSSKIAIFGIGGVGSYVIEALVRAGIENFILVDNDKVSVSNLNRQLIATIDTIDKYKVQVAKERILQINPNAKIETYTEFFGPNSPQLFDKTVDYVIDAVDNVTAKIELIIRANNLNVPIISSMGTGNKLDPCKFEITDIYKTSVCPLAKVIRKELRTRGVKHLKVLYSKEEPIKPVNNTNNKKQTPGSISFVPSVAGLIIAGEVIKNIIK